MTADIYTMYSLILASLLALPVFSSPLPNGTLERRKGGGGGGRGGGGGGGSRGGSGGGGGGSQSGGVIAGIIIGSIAGIVIVVVLYTLWLNRSARKKREYAQFQKLEAQRAAFMVDKNAETAAADQYPQMEISLPDTALKNKPPGYSQASA